MARRNHPTNVNPDSRTLVLAFTLSTSWLEGKPRRGISYATLPIATPSSLQRRAAESARPQGRGPTPRSMPPSPTREWDSRSRPRSDSRHGAVREAPRSCSTVSSPLRHHVAPWAADGDAMSPPRGSKGLPADACRPSSRVMDATNAERASAVDALPDDGVTCRRSAGFPGSPTLAVQSIVPRSHADCLMSRPPSALPLYTGGRISVSRSQSFFRFLTAPAAPAPAGGHDVGSREDGRAVGARRLPGGL